MKRAFKRLKAQNGQYYFTIKSAHGKILAHSELYKSKRGMEKGIDAVKKVVMAEIEDKDDPSKIGL